MEDKRKYKIIDNINGVYYELNTADEFETYLQDILQELTTKSYYNGELGETITYYKQITTIRNDYTLEENKNYQTIINIYGDDYKQINNPYYIW